MQLRTANYLSTLTSDQFSLRLKTLLDKRRTIQARNASTSKISASFATLVEGFQQFDNDLNKLQVRTHDIPLMERVLRSLAAAIRWGK